MNITKKKIAVASVTATVTVLLLAAVVLFFHFENTSKNATITVNDNITTVSVDNTSYYDISTYGIDFGIYDESDYNRLNNIQIDINNENFSDSLTAYYTDKSVFKYFLNEELEKRTFFGNDVYFITSTDDAQLLVKKDIIMPQLNTENISKIIIATTNGTDILFDDNTEISEFISEIDYYTEMLSSNQNYQEYQVYYKNTDPGIYEIINNKTFNYLT